MKLETLHRGTRIAVRVCTPPQRMTAIMAIVEDEEATALLLQLYHQPDELAVPAAEMLQPGTVLILKEPFFKCRTDGAYSLRVDHVSDIIWLKGTEEHIPSQWRKAKSTSNDSTSVRFEGNQAVEKSNWAGAQLLYTSAIETAVTAEDERLAHLNRSLANLRLGRLESALSDAVRGGSDSRQASEKGIFREARALYELGFFDRCLQKLHQLLESHPRNSAAEQELRRVETRLLEQQGGRYVFDQMYKQAKKTPPLVDCASYAAVVEVRKSPGRGYGLFTNTAVSVGELLLCEKAFAYSYADDETTERCQILMNLSTKMMTVGGQARLLNQVIQKLYHNPRLSAEFRELHHGDYKPVPVCEIDGIPVVDSFFVEKVISLNSFGAPRTSRSSFSKFLKKTTTGESQERSHTTCGIWLLASRINHSCVGNCLRSFIGDMQIVRATRNLEAGTEITFPYRVPVPHESYETAHKGLSNWGFSCTCELCEDRRKTTRGALKQRTKLVKELEKVLGGPVMTDISRAKLLLEKLEKTYPPTDGAHLRLELWNPYFALGAHLLLVDRPSDAVEMIAKGFEALDFRMTASSQRLDIEKWGVVNDFVPCAFANLFKAYIEIAPELCKPAEEYAEIAYSIVVGESETICDAFPELA
ncbi:hypothetical protein J3458_013334 [Metarhizium acridum]|uniref:uncharacterized protein n=1 Tax=Metarhizium acridum TaxID=92637 RepID=UPI001C6B666D|nr:hypothetical protein J3458_013334 [Metarhizium acridum]